MRSSQPPPVLEYNKPTPKPVVQVRHPPLATILLLLNTLLGAAMLLAIFHPDRLGVATWVIVLAGAMLIYVTLGCLSADCPRFVRAVVLGTLACVLSASAFYLTFDAARQLEAQILRGKTGTVVVYIKSDRGGQLATLRLARNVCAVASVTGAGVVVYSLLCTWRASGRAIHSAILG